MKIFNKVSLGVVVLAVAFTLGLAGLLRAATTVDLGEADDFAILAGSAITETGTTVISGDVGLSPTGGAAITGLTAVEVTGTIYAVDAGGPAGSVNDPALLTLAKNALTAAYTDAAGQTPVTVASQLGGTTKTAGVYNTADGELGITGTLILDAAGDADAVFIFKAASTLITAGSSEVSLINGAQACNVFWQVGSSATLGTNSTFKGNILALTSATLNTGANVEGRVLARNGAVTLDGNTITKATCVTPPATPGSGGSSGSGTGTPHSYNIRSNVPPLISIEKVPTPLALPDGAGSVTYDYTVLNVGETDMSTVTVTDNSCTPVTFVSGDTDLDLKLDQSETWKYSCTTKLSQTTTNTVTATGNANGFTAIDTANATVVVGAPLVPPLIHLVKVPSVFALPVGGGAVTYTYTVTNPGTEPLHDVSVIDNKCTGLPGRVVGHPGDLNKNDLLESNEKWSFTCQTKIAQTTTNTGTAEGSANGLTALDFAVATVTVLAPGFPDTGILPGGDITWDTILLAAILLVVSTTLAIVMKKRPM